MRCIVPTRQQEAILQRPEAGEGPCREGAESSRKYAKRGRPQRAERANKATGGDV